VGESFRGIPKESIFLNVINVENAMTLSSFFLSLVPVHIKEPIQNVTTRVGSKATLRCEISGDPPILETGWKRGMTEIKSDSDSR